MGQLHPISFLIWLCSHTSSPITHDVSRFKLNWCFLNVHVIYWPVDSDSKKACLNFLMLDTCQRIPCCILSIYSRDWSNDCSLTLSFVTTQLQAIWSSIYRWQWEFLYFQILEECFTSCFSVWYHLQKYCT